MLFDEPTSALDLESDAAVQCALKDLTKGWTMLIIVRRVTTVTSADRIYVMDQGCVAETGSHSDLLKKNGIYARLHQLQFQGAD